MVFDQFACKVHFFVCNYVLNGQKWFAFFLEMSLLLIQLPSVPFTVSLLKFIT